MPKTKRRPVKPRGSTPLGKLRQAANYTIDRSAEAMGVNRSSVCSWEAGRTGITAAHAAALADLYHTTPEEINGLIQAAQQEYLKY